MPRLIIADAAADEFRSALANLSDFSEAAAIRLHSRVLRRLADLERYPEFGRLRPEFAGWLPNIRSSAVNPLVIFYQHTRPDTVDVLASWMLAKICRRSLDWPHRTMIRT